MEFALKGHKAYRYRKLLTEAEKIDIAFEEYLNTLEKAREETKLPNPKFTPNEILLLQMGYRAGRRK